MRVLYCNKYNFRFSGTEAYLFETMEQMRARGHEVALFSMANARGEAREFDHHFVPATDFKEAAGALQKARLAMRAVYSVEARKRIACMIEEFEPDVVHVRNIYHHLSPSILWELKSQGIPVLYHLNDFKLICPSYNLVSAGNACERCKGGKFWNVVREGCYTGGRAASVVLAAEAYAHRWAGSYAKCVDLIVTPSRFAKQKLTENGWREDKVEVLPHFQNCPALAPQFPGSCAPVLYFGRLSAEKGLDDLLAAMRQLPGIQLIIAGEGPQRAELEASARDLGLANVSFAGYVSGTRLEKLIADAQFTIFPSHAYETMGKSILESYAQGRTVIASDLGSRRELVEDGETGLLYRSKDVQGLAAAIEFLYRQPELARKMGEAGRRVVRERYSKEHHLSALELIYGNLARKSLRSSKPDFAPPRSPGSRTVHAEPLRIAFIGGRGVIGKYSGIESYYEEVGSRLAAMGHEVTVYCRKYFTPEVKTYRGLRLVRLPTIRTKHLETFVHTLLSTVHACFSDYDVVHFHALGPSMFAMLPRLFGKKTVVTVQGLDWKRRKWGPAARAALRFSEWTSARLPNQTVVVSRTLQNHYSSHYAKECVYVPNGTEIRS